MICNTTIIPLNFDAWIALSARLLERDAEARLDVLTRAEIDPTNWNRCDVERTCATLLPRSAVDTFEHRFWR